MKMIIKDNNKIVYETEDTKDIVSNLMYLMYAKCFNQAKGLVFKYSYNYSDVQNVKVIDRRDSLNKREYTFQGVYTSWGSLDTYKLLEDLEVKPKEV